MVLKRMVLKSLENSIDTEKVKFDIDAAKLNLNAFLKQQGRACSCIGKSTEDANDAFQWFSTRERFRGDDTPSHLFRDE